MRELLGCKCVYLSAGIHHYDLNMTQGNSGALELNGNLRRVVALELGVLMSRRHNCSLLAYYGRNVVTAKANSITVHSAQE